MKENKIIYIKENLLNLIILKIIMLIYTTKYLIPLAFKYFLNLHILSS